MATPTVKDPKYINWIKAGIGLLIVKRSISPATMRIIEEFYKAICGVPIPPPGAAVAAPGCSCTFKDIDFKKKCMKTGCTICNPFVQAILAAHKYPTIYKDNCDPCKWSTHTWEIAKAFMGPGQQKDNHDAEHTDCANVVLLWENCSHFTTHISDQTLLKKVREARNAGMHSPKMTLSDAEMKSAFAAMIKLLQDATLSVEPDIDASSGISELEKVRDQGISIMPEDELKVWLDDMKSLGKNWEDLKTQNEPVAAFLQKKPGLLKRISQVWPRLQRRVSAVEQGLFHVEQRLHHEEHGLRQVGQGLHQVEQRLNRGEQRLHHEEQELHHVKQGLHSAELGWRDVEQRVGVLQEDVAGIQLKTKMAEKSKDQEDSMALLQELRRDLAESYLTGECSQTQPISSLCKMLPVEELLVPVSLRRTTRGNFGQEEKNQSSIGAEDILSSITKKSTPPKRVLVDGEPGRGKSMMSKSLALGWAQNVLSQAPESATQQDSASRSLPDPATGSQSVSCTGKPTRPTNSVAVSTIKTFTILIVFLVHQLTAEGFSENVIHLLTEKWKSRKDAVRKCLGDNCEEVLLILDGFDEATSPQPEILPNILAGKVMKGCTIITTSRPGFCKSAFDASYHLEGFTSEKRESYIHKFMSAIHHDPNDPRGKLLLQRLKSPGTFGNLCETPLFLVLVCVVCTQEKNTLPDRRTELYQQFDDFIHDEAVERQKIPSQQISYLRQVLRRVAFAMLMDNSSEITAATILKHSSAEPTAPGPSAAKPMKHDSSPMEATRENDVMTRLSHVGFVAQSQQLQGLKSVTTAHFIHQSFVDFFAAKHVTSSIDEQHTTLLDLLFKHNDIFHNVFVFIAGLATNSNLLVKLLTRWWGAVAAERMPSFNPSDLRGDMERMGELTRDKHALHHAPLDWLAESTAACSAVALSTHTQLKAVCLTYRCTEVCLRGITALCEASSNEQRPTPSPLYMGVYECDQFKACEVLALLEKAALTRGAIVPVYLWLGWLGSRPVWTEAECRSLAALLPQLKQIREIVIPVRGWSGLEALSHGFTADTQLQYLEVYCRPDDDRGDHALPEFLSHVQLLSNIEEILLYDRRGCRVSDAAERELKRWGREHGVTVEVQHLG